MFVELKVQTFFNIPTITFKTQLKYQSVVVVVQINSRKKKPSRVINN
jgi:hypothetical protein